MPLAVRLTLIACLTLVPLASVGCYALLAENVAFDCDRNSGDCVLSQARLYGTEVRHFPVRALSGAEIDASNDDGAASRLVLVFERGARVPFMNYLTGIGMDVTSDQADAVRRFVSDPEVPHLHIERDMRLMAGLVAAVPLLFGGIFAAGTFYATRRS